MLRPYTRVLNGSFNMWCHSNGVLNDDMEERDVESIQHVESLNRRPRGAQPMAKTGACITRVDSSA